MNHSIDYGVQAINSNGYYATFDGDKLCVGMEAFSTGDKGEAYNWFEKAVDEMSAENKWCDGKVKLVKLTANEDTGSVDEEVLDINNEAYDHAE